MTEFAINKCKAKGLAWLKVGDDKSLQGPIAKLIPDESREALLTQTNTKPGDSIFFIAEHPGIVEKLAGEIRKEIGIRLDLIDKNEFKNPLDIYAYQFDLVCNGYEVASGAVRNHDPEIMIKAFEIANYTEEEINRKFEALYNSFHYGAPPHSGIAPGIDRILMLLTDEESIREVIAFPMNSKAQDLLMKAPGIVSKKQLEEDHIKLD